MLISSCDQTRVYEKNLDFETRHWHQDTIPAFSFHIENPQETYNIFANVRNTLDYPFQNLYLYYQLSDSLGNEVLSELQNIMLFDPKTGKPLNGGIGDIYDHQVTLLEDYSFPKNGGYILELQQYMRRDSLPEIVSIGVRVEKAEE